MRTLFDQTERFNYQNKNDTLRNRLNRILNKYGDIKKRVPTGTLFQFQNYSSVAVSSSAAGMNSVTPLLTKILYHWINFLMSLV